MSTGAAFISPYSGSRLLDDGRTLSSAVREGNWLDGGIAFLDTLGNAGAALSDPIGTIASCGLGWVMNHIKPLSTWLEQLAGSESNVASVARQWTSAGATMRETGSVLTSRLRDLEGLSGDTVTTYIRFAQDTSRHLAASGEWAESAATGLLSASTLVTRMQGIVKQAISQVISVAIEAMAVVAASMGLGMGYAIARVVTKVNQLVNKVVRPLTQVLKSVKALTGLVGQLRSLFGNTGAMMSTLLGGSAQAASITAGTVTDASGATRLGASGYADLVRANSTADAWHYSPSGVTRIDGIGADLTADAPMSGGTVSGTGGTPGSINAGGGGSITALGGQGSVAGTGMHTSGITGMATAAAVSTTASAASGAGASNRMMMPPGAMSGAREGGQRSGGLGMRRPRLEIVLEAFDDDETD
ncbi:hypothetical protein LQ938_00050 [Microbacterium sp. cx-55]|uniref:hypothetical protein n=1 Tax=unclassified Microbacterium TaxID=2609290 RepID=UPI001CBEAD83|nr:MULTISPECIES: hypothetical protein [unclassified Microbacterium]MBZ4487195.1 hypothetical protein [Microbacterium sp. cx-55]MCC4908687.1 hypothetical protein [Microbacterium sp. cx-59]UGB35220.1 hypothetical protein LQ938_00050 [Microbacterium sp. cx-55]